jgi:hypothetical protein
MDRACVLRWKAVQLLEKHGAVTAVSVEQLGHRWESIIHLRTDERRFSAVLKAVDNEAKRRAKQDEHGDASSPTAAEVAKLKLPEQVTPAWLWKNVSVTTWLAWGALLVATFMTGIGAGEVSLVRELLHLAPLQRAGASAGSLSVVSEDLIVDVGGPARGIPLRTSLKVAAERGAVSLSRTAEVKSADLDRVYFLAQGVAPRLQSVMPERVALSDGAESEIHLEFNALSLVAAGESVRYLSPGSVKNVGQIVLRLHYDSGGSERFVDVKIPVFVRA